MNWTKQEKLDLLVLDAETAIMRDLPMLKLELQNEVVLRTGLHPVNDRNTVSLISATINRLVAWKRQVSITQRQLDTVVRELN